MNILVTSAGRRVSLVKSFQRELKNIYPEAKVIAIDSEPLLSAACIVADDYFKVPRLDNPSYIQNLLELCIEHSIKLIIPTIDTELLELARHKSIFEEKGVTIVISSLDLVIKCRDKREMHNFFSEKGVSIAKEYTKENFELPIYIKPYDGSRSVDNYIIKDRKDLTKYHFNNKKLMFLEYLDHDEYEEFTCDLYYNKEHKLQCVVPRKRLEVRDGEVYKSLTKDNALIPYIKNKLGFIEGAIGCLTAQFFKHKNDDKKIYGIEINPRFGGGYPLTYLCGANYTKWIIDEYIANETIENKFDVWERNLLMIRYDDEILVHEYKG
ncbi:ATP-grasp domain-containing protein [Winogradskyella ursingii]|uniref:ATP-grasp domain-containing protein n=1 Tax=Winogradskyella ursingii TaxID=2686079 RepID=UPI0015C72DC5|nr:ATP-grasp domain-containing protein [Winogradskyella ursingii]